jgi:hypothetical protein
MDSRIRIRTKISRIRNTGVHNTATGYVLLKHRDNTETPATKMYSICHYRCGIIEKTSITSAPTVKEITKQIWEHVDTVKACKGITDQQHL